MAGVLKVRDADGTLRTITAVKVRDTDGTLRTLSFIRIRDAGGTLREVFTSGGGGSPNPTYISPGSADGSSTPSLNAYFTVYASSGSPTAYAWGVLDGSGSVVSGGTTATAQLRVTATPGDYATATFYCDVTISSVVYRALCSMSLDRTGGGDFL